MSCSFLVGVQLARSLGADGYGTYGLAMSIVAILTIPAEIGLPQLLTREIAVAREANNWGQIQAVIRWGRRTVCLMALAVAASVVLWLHVSGRGLGSPLGLTLLAGIVMVPLVALNNLQGASLRGLQYLVQGQLPDALLRPVIFALLLLVVPWWLDRADPALAMGLGALSAALACLATTWMLRRALKDGAGIRPTVVDARGWWGSAIPMALTEGMRVLQGHLLVLLMGVISTSALVGVFRVATSVALLITVSITILNIVSSPLVAQMHARGDRTELQKLMRWVALGMVACTTLVSAPFFVGGEYLLATLFGAEFAEAAVPLSILCGGWIISGAFGECHGDRAPPPPPRVDDRRAVRCSIPHRTPKHPRRCHPFQRG